LTYHQFKVLRTSLKVSTGFKRRNGRSSKYTKNKSAMKINIDEISCEFVNLILNMQKLMKIYFPFSANENKINVEKYGN
jgi:hypothetical protein